MPVLKPTYDPVNGLQNIEIGSLTAGQREKVIAQALLYMADGLSNFDELEVLIGALNSTKETDPDVASASVNSLLRGILNRLIIGDNQTGTELTAPAESTVFNTGNFSNHNFQVTIANIDTDVVLRVEGSLDNTNWFNIDASGEDITYITNGTYLLQRSNVSIPYMRLYFVSETGGTAATINSIYRGGN